MKKPSLKGMKHTEHLGHFAQAKYLCQGHNDSGTIPLKPENEGMDDPNWFVPAEGEAEKAAYAKKKPLPVQVVEQKKQAALVKANAEVAKRARVSGVKKKPKPVVASQDGDED